MGTIRHSGGPRAALAALALLGALTTAGASSAQAKQGSAPAAADKDQRAKDLYAKGDTAYAEGRYEEALASFQEAYALSGRPQLLFNVSNAAERLGHYSEAVDALDKYLATGKPKDRDVVQKRLVNLRKRVDEQKKEQDRLAKEEEDRRAKQEADRKKLEADQAASAPAQPERPAPPPPESHTPVGPIVLMSLGGAALVAGGVFGVLTLGARSDVSKGCKDAAGGGKLCTSDASSAIDKEKTFSLVTDISLASGIVLAGVGVYLLVSGGDTHKAHAVMNAPVHLAGGPGQGGMSLVGSF
ncbi:MAG: Tetratricopeptide 4 [Labilithrix sp.]|nr:Tetratricopeptide 4 [Labilithrix sp.]